MPDPCRRVEAQGELFEQVSVDDSLWTLETVEGVPSIVLTLEKALQPCYWPRLFKHASPQANPAEAETGMALYYESRGMYKEALDAYLRASEAVRVATPSGQIDSTSF